MLDCKTFEVRDRGTFIPCFGILCREAQPPYHSHENPHASAQADRYLLGRAGFGKDPPYYVIFGRLEGGTPARHETYDWGDRTMHVAHKHVAENWNILECGAVIDVEFILGETASCKESERVDEERQRQGDTLDQATRDDQELAALMDECARASGQPAFRKLDDRRRQLITRAWQRRPITRIEYIVLNGYECWLKFCEIHKFPENYHSTELPGT